MKLKKTKNLNNISLPSTRSKLSKRKKIIKFIFAVSLIFTCQSYANVEAIKKNNQAVDYFEQALKQAVAEPKDANIFTKFFQRIMENLGEKKSQEKTAENVEGLKSNDQFKGEQFTPNQSEKQKKENSIDQSLVFEGYKNIIEATLADNESSEIRLNLGLGFELSGDLEKAEKVYKNLVSQLDVEMSSLNENSPKEDIQKYAKLAYFARYNYARVLGVQKKVDEAISIYQKALEIVPSSEQVKVNIELLMQAKQGKGKGKGDDKDKKDGKEGEKNPDPNAPIKENPKNSEYKSQNLSKEDVEKILGELKNQEQKIRDKEYNKKIKERPRDKDW